MPRVCNTCSHPETKEIDKLLLGNTPFRVVSRQFDISRDSVRNHARTHLGPLIEQANKRAETQIVDRITTYRREVNYAPLDKVKFVQGQLLNEYDQAVDSAERVRIFREMRGWFQEEAKLCGYYVLDQENPIQLKQKAQAVIRAVQMALEANPGQDRRLLMTKMAEIAARIED